MEILSFGNCCRICLEKEKTLLSLQTEVEFGGLKLTCLEMYCGFTGIEEPALGNDKMSQKICISCFAELNNCFKFQRKAIDSFNTFLQAICRTEDDNKTNNMNCIQKEEQIVDLEEEPTSPSMQEELDIYEETNDVEETMDSVSSTLQEKGEYEELRHEPIAILNESVVDVYEEDFLEVEYFEARNENVSVATNENLVEIETNHEDQNNQLEQVALEDKLSTSDKEYKCVVCSSLLGSQSELDNHFVAEHCQHESNGDFVCSVCNKRFGTRKTVRQHCRIHQAHDSRRFRCRYCSKAFNYGHHLKIHETTHTMEKPFSCTSCDKRFASKDRLKNHIQQHSNEIRHHCKSCPSSFKSKKALKMHDILKHDAAVAKFVPTNCDRCGKDLYSQSAATAHFNGPCGQDHFKSSAKKATIKKEYSCQQCDRVFKTRSTLVVHQTGHRTRTASCMDCPEVFDTFHDLRRHRRQVHDNRIHSCEICGKGFQQMVVLNRHLNTHTGDKPFDCSVCNKSFAQPATLKNHKLTHSEAQQFECSQCPKKYKFIASLNNHVSLCHDGE